MGDPTLLETEFHDVDAQTVSNMFGADFAQTVFSLGPRTWAGPAKSGYGVHLVLVKESHPSTIPPFEEVRPKVLEEWRRQREDQTKALYLDKLREKYGVVIDDSISVLLGEPPAEVKTQ
jgi:parvulin-like peptidyl-prolyl isomerase